MDRSTVQKCRPQWRQHRICGWLSSLLIATGCGLVRPVPAVAQTQAPTQPPTQIVSAQSPYSRSRALEAARSNLPPGAVVSGSSCNDVEIGDGNFRYFCQITYTVPVAPSAKPAPSSP